MRNDALIDIHMTLTAATMGIRCYCLSSSVCVYRDMQPGEPEMTEDQAIPENPDNEYCRGKLYTERTGQVCRQPYGM